MNKIIGITGVMGSGKDTFAIPIKGAGYVDVKFSKTLKDMVAVLLRDAGVGEERIQGHVYGDVTEKNAPIPEIGGVSGRHLMQTLGTEWGRRLVRDDLWLMGPKFSFMNFGLTVSTDVRFPNELELIKSLGGIVIRVEREGTGSLKGSLHPSEVGILDLPVDFVVHNDGSIADLHEKALSFIAA